MTHPIPLQSAFFDDPDQLASYFDFIMANLGHTIDEVLDEDFDD